MKALITFGVASLAVVAVLSTVAAQTANSQESDATRSREIRNEIRHWKRRRCD
jgi:hypothetical protein